MNYYSIIELKELLESKGYLVFENEEELFEYVEKRKKQKQK